MRSCPIFPQYITETMPHRAICILHTHACHTRIHYPTSSQFTHFTQIHPFLCEKWRRKAKDTLNVISYDGNAGSANFFLLLFAFNFVYWRRFVWNLKRNGNYNQQSRFLMQRPFCSVEMRKKIHKYIHCMCVRRTKIDNCHTAHTFGRNHNLRFGVW